MENKESEINFFAKTNYRNREVPFGIKLDDRRRHMYVIGKTGMGKTTMMENMVIQDILNGHGVCFIDPHGDSIVKILNFVPNDRVNDVVYFNPSDLDHPIAFNILEAVESRYKHLVASGLMGVFTKIWANLWSARMEYILNNTILALLDSPGNTMLGITRMYIDKKYRKKIIDNIKDPMVRSFWVDEFANYNDKYRTEAIAPIQNKVGQFLSSAIIRNIVGQPRSTIDLRGIMDNRKILMVDLSKGKVGEDNAALLGAMIITKLQLAALSRVDVPEIERQDFFLYVDEFQNFVTDSFATILSEARKYRLNLTVGHQYIGQLIQEKNTKVRDAVFGNVGTMVVFRVGAADAEYLETEFSPDFLPTDIVNLPKYNILLKLMINGVASNPFTAVTMPADEANRSDNGEKVIKVSRERYGNPVAEVEEKISRWMGAEFHEQQGIQLGAADLETSGEEELPPRVSEPRIQAPRQQPQPRAAAAIEAPARTVPAEEPEPERMQVTGIPISEDKPLVYNGDNDLSFEAPQPAPAPAPQTPATKPQERRNNDRPPRREHDRDQNRRPQSSGTRYEPRHERRGSAPSHKSSQKFNAPPKKAHNPIWDTVADMNQKRTEDMGNSVAELVRNSVQHKPEQQASQVPERAPNPAPAPPQIPQADPQVLKPGETHTF